MSKPNVPASLLLIALLALLPARLSRAQTGPTAQPQQAPRTAPQVQEVLPSYEGQNVTSVELAGQPELNTNSLFPLLAQHAGEPFAKAKVDQSIAALQNTGRFQAVELEIRPEANGIRVLFVLQPAIYFGVYEFPGALGRFGYARLLQISDYPPRGAYTPVDVDNAQLALETFFKRNGYFQAEVRPQLQVDKAHGVVNVLFQTTLKQRAKFGDVVITGASPEETEKLRKSLRNVMARLKGADIRPGKSFSLKKIQNATQRLENTLMSEGRLGATVKLVGANYDPETRRADISFNVTPGPLVHVKVQGAHLWSWTRHRLLPIYQQNGLDPELIQEGRQNLVSYFQSKGYFDVKVTSDVQQQSNSETILYQITKGPRHKVAGVEIAGNDHLGDKKLMGHVKVVKARWWTHGKFSDKLVRQSVSNLKRVYQAEGYSSVQVTPQVTNRNGNIAVTLRVDEGPQDVVEALRLDGNTVPESQLAPQGLKLAPGQPYSQKYADEDRNQIMAQYLRMGYLNASFRETAHPVGGDKHRLEVVYQITEGPRVETAKIVTLGRKETRQPLIDRVAALGTNKPLREDELLTSESKLYTLGIFDWAEIDPRRTITTQTEEDVLVKVHEAKRNSITYGLGFEVINRGGSIPSGTVAVPGVPPVGLPKEFKTAQKTFWGPRGSFEYTRKNIRGKAETLTLAGLAGRLDQHGSINFTDPHFRSTNWASSLTLSGEHNSENPVFTFRQGEAGGQLQRALNPDQTENLFLRYNFRETGLTRLLIPDLVPPEDQHVRLSTLSATFVRDTRDNAIDAHKGFYQTAEIHFTSSALGSSVDFARLLGQAAYYRNLGKNIIWANSVRIGLAQPFSGSHVPISEQFFSGGPNTLRGFALNGAGPQHQIEICGETCFSTFVPTGGKQLFIVNSEFRIPTPLPFPLMDKLGVALFYDGGNVFQNIGFHNFAENYSNTVGFGLRYSTPLGPVRIDFGRNLNPDAGIQANLNPAPPIKSWQWFVTLGQAF